jgi:peptidoglycan/LPS O-acetylase OafA/YrhL
MSVPSPASGEPPTMTGKTIAPQAARTMKRIPTLDGWRAAAILAVIGHHVAASYGHESLWLWHGAMGVDIFFAVSGLLITSQLLQNSSLKNFYIRRVFRILPPAFLYLAVVFALHLITGGDLLACLLIRRNYIVGSGYTSHFWSLSLEEQFYLVWPLVLLWSGRRAKLTAFLCIIALCIWRAVALTHLNITALAYSRTDMRCDGLLWGCISAYILRAGTIKIGKVMPPVCLGVAVLVFGIPYFLPILPILLSCVVLGTIQEPTSVLSRVLEWKPLIWIGERSYGLYLWHVLFITAPINLPMIVKVGATVVWCALMYRCFETPLRKMGRKLASYSTRRKEYDAIVSECC